MFQTAITRKPGEDFAAGITSANLGKPDYATILRQHDAYVQTLRSLGLQVVVLDALPGYPDAYFVEDPAVVFAEAAVITRPGAAARRGEETAIEEELKRWKALERITAPGTLEGGDILLVERHFFIGITERTNPSGAQQLGAIVEKYGYTWTAVPVDAGLHLKSGVNTLGGRRLLVTPQFAGRPEFAAYEQILTAPGEDYCANTLHINGTLLTPAGFPGTLGSLRALGMPLVEMQVSEVQKMDGGLTCMSLRF